VLPWSILAGDIIRATPVSPTSVPAGRKPTAYDLCEGKVMQLPRTVTIVGGGTAGWMAANLMAARWAGRNVTISLIESPEIGIIGVGEGSTPQLKAFFDGIGVSEQEWMPQCNATYKTGITFRNWSTKPGYEHYFHPFHTTLDQSSHPAFVYHCYLRRCGVDVDAHPDRFFLNTYLAAHRLGPRPNHNFPFVVPYGYHFDAQLVGGYLRKVAVSRGVRHLQRQVLGVVPGPGGDIAHLQLDGGDTHCADFFVDCTGFRGMLLQQALKVPFRTFASNLFNDAAVVMPTPQEANPHSQTISTAMRHGWAWEIPLTSRIGNGYVYSSSHCSADAAERELREHLGLLESDVVARHLKVRVGCVERHWHRNCLALGLSQGFIEPLEATALHIVLETIEGYLQSMEGDAPLESLQDEFNDVINRRFEGVRDYIVCHYRASSRADTPYWRENAANEQLPDNLKEILRAWLAQQDITMALEELKIGDYYNTLSWHCLLAGYGIFPPGPYRTPTGPKETRHSLAQIADYVQRCALNFRPHAEQLQDLVAG
jgi:hypothetical protein